jgi:hypothetical protein
MRICDTPMELMPHCGFVADGGERHLAAVRADVTAAVEAEFADRLARATFVGRMRIRARMRREKVRRVESRMSELASPWAMY